MSVTFNKISAVILVIMLFTSCYEYDDYKVNNIVSSYNNQQIIRKTLKLGDADGYFNYKNDSDSDEQRLLNGISNQHIGICAIDCNEKLQPIIWSSTGNSFILHFNNRNDTPTIPFGERLFVFKVVEGEAINIHQVEDKKIIETFYLGDFFNYITSENTDTIKIEYN